MHIGSKHVYSCNDDIDDDDDDDDASSVYNI